MEALGLFDLLSPYFLTGIDLGPVFHTLLATVHVDEVDSCFDESGVAVWGLARLDLSQATSQFSIGPNGLSASASAQTGSSTQPGPKGAVWDWHDVTFQFRITAPRSASSMIANALQTLSGAGQLFSNLTSVFTAWGGSSTPQVTDYPNLQFELDLMLTLATVHLPFLTGAQLDPSGVLKPDPANSDVRLVLPKILVTLTQDGTLGHLNFILDSWGAETIDDPADTGEAQLIQMLPPYALVGDTGTFGFGFDKAVLDLSDNHTPPELLSQYGVGDNWQGVYLPDLRVFVAPSGAQGLAVDVSAHDLLIGVGQSQGVSGDFEVDVVNLNTKPRLRVVFYDPANTVISADQQHGVVAVALPKNCSLVVDVQGAVPPYQVVVDSTDITATQTLAITNFTAAHDYQITVTDAKSQKTQLTVQAVPQATSGNPQPVPPPSNSDLQLKLTSANDGVHTITLTNPKLGTLQFAPFVQGIQVTVDSQAPQTLTSDTLNVSVAAGAVSNISATWPGTASNTTVELKGWFHFDRPPKATYPQTTPDGLLVNTPTTPGTPAPGDVLPPDHIEVSDQEDQTKNTTAIPFATPLVGSAELANFISNLTDGQATPFEIHGFASYEGTEAKAQYNTDLSERRAIALAMIIAQAAQGTQKRPQMTELPKGNNTGDPALPGGVSAETAWGSGTTPDSAYVYADYWLAHATYQAAQNGPPATVTATLTGPPTTPPTPTPQTPVTLKPPGADQNRPAWFRSIKVIVRISQNTFIALEISGEVAIATAAQDQLQAKAQQASVNAAGSPNITAKNLPGNPNPDDGVIDYDLIISHDDSTNTWTEQLTIGAGKNDKDGLARWGDPVTDDQATPNNDVWRDLLGSIIVFAPLLSEAAQAGSEIGGWKGGLFDVAAVGAAAAIGGFGILHAETITLYGGEGIIKEGSAGGEFALFLDVEVDLYLDVLGLLTTKPSKPIKVRYKAVGVELLFQKGVSNPGLPVVFDASKGFSIDVTDPGTFHLPAGLDDIIQILGARIARTNPLNLEVDLGIKADLGVVSVDRAKIRWPMSPVGVPTISALGASVDIPGAFSGKGYLSVSDTGMAGSIDITIVPIGLRAKASLAIAKTPPDPSGNVATGVAISLEVDFPAPIILGDSGLGIYGFIALFAMHYRRTIDDAMTWYKSPPVNGDPTQVAKPEDWTPQYGHWAFGAGAVLGTMDGGFVMNLKGVLVLELPGPRLLLFMDANILVPSLPDLTGSSTGTILATLDLDFGRGTLSIGLQVNYNLSPLFEISIPADAFFDFNDPSNFSLDLGTIKNPATVSVIDTFVGSGYLEIHGNGIPDFPLHPLGGFSIALGISVSLIWGDTSINLYLEIGASAAVGIGFSPFFLAGQLTISGQLHLFVISISASGSLTLLSDGTSANTSISGQICGSVSFFFFSVSGCVGFTLGPSTVTVPPPPLVRQLYLQSRSPALVQGTGVDRPIDANLGDASEDSAKAPTVPIDSIPVLKFAFTPQLDQQFATFTELPGTAPGLPPSGWNQRGQNFYRYTIQKIALNGPPLLNSAAGVPSTWRLNSPPNGDDRAIDLALMDWTPCATPRAVVSSSTLDSQVQHIWGTICDAAAPPAPVFWDFERAKTGPSPTGWMLTGVAWPDPANTVRSAPPPLQLTITELWRTGIAIIDSLTAIQPAYVLAWPVPCISPKLTAPTRDGLVGASPPRIMSATAQDALPRIDRGLKNLARFVPREPAPRVSPAFHRVFGNLTAQADALSSLKSIAGLHPETSALIGRASAAALGGKSSPAAQSAPLSSDAPRKGATGCQGRVLVAPFAGRRLFFGEEFSRLPRAQSPLAKANPDLTDALLFSGVPLTRVRLYLWVGIELIRYRSLTLRALDANNQPLGDQAITRRQVGAPTDLPAEWIQHGGPWTNDALLAWEFLYTYGVLRENLDAGIPILADLHLPAGTAKFILGVKSGQDSDGGLNYIQIPPAYMVAAVEGWSTAEQQRSSYDQTTQSQQLSGLQGALSGDPSTLPLFAPGQQYSITVNYTAESAPDDGHGKPDLSKATAPAPNSQTLYFQTDASFQIDDPTGARPPKPATLNPWVLCVWPGHDEPYHFYNEPITVVFSTDAIEQLVGAYGLTLQGNARAGTFQPPPSSPNNAKTKAKVFPLTPVKGNILTPWQEAVNAAAEQGVIPCVAGSGATTTYGKQTFNLLLNPLTPYTFDLETNPPPPLQTVGSYTPGAPPPAPVAPLYRTAFETSRYAALADLIADVAGSKVTYRHLTSGASGQLAALSATPTDPALQSALNAAGLGVVPLAKQPTVTVFWEDAQPAPVPVGVLLDMPEPLQRKRQTPTPIYDPNPLNDPSRVNRIIEWQMQPQIWLDLVETSGGVAKTIAVSTNGSRLYVSLASGARGKTLVLAMRRYQTAPIDATDAITDTPLLSLDLQQAPWEGQ